MFYKKFKLKDKRLILSCIIIITAIAFFIKFESAWRKPKLKVVVTVKEEEKSLKDSSSIAAEKNFSIQICSFQDKARAESVLEKLKKENYPAYIVIKDLEEKGIWHRVLIGRFKTRQEAKTLLEKIKKDYKHSFIILC